MVRKPDMHFLRCLGEPVGQQCHVRRHTTAIAHPKNDVALLGCIAAMIWRHRFLEVLFNSGPHIVLASARRAGLKEGWPRKRVRLRKEENRSKPALSNQPRVLRSEEGR